MSSILESSNKSASNLSNMLSQVNQELKNEAIRNMQELISMFQDKSLSTFHKIRIYYNNTDKFKLADLSIAEMKLKIRFLTAICYDVLNLKYAQLLNQILKDKNKVSENPEYRTGEMTGFGEFLDLISVVQLEMAIYNIDNNNNVYKFTEIDEVLTMKDAIETRYNCFMSELKNKYLTQVLA